MINIMRLQINLQKVRWIYDTSAPFLVIISLFFIFRKTNSITYNLKQIIHEEDGFAINYCIWQLVCR